MNKSSFYVYKMVDPRTNQPFYVGKGTANRMYSHEVEARSKYWYNEKKCKQICDIWSDGLSVLYEKIPCHDEVEAFSLEKKLISDLGCLHNNTGLLTNIHPGGSGRGRTKKQVYQYMLDGTLLNIHESVAAAAGALQTSMSGISAACRGELASYDGFLWSYTNEDMSPYERVSAMRKPVHRYDMLGTYIDTFAHATEACEMLSAPIVAASKIQSVCLGKLPSYKNFQWRYDYHATLPALNPKKKRVHQIDINTNRVIATFASISEACRKTHITGISAVCNKKYSQAGGYGWRFVDEQSSNDTPTLHYSNIVEQLHLTGIILSTGKITPGKNKGMSLLKKHQQLYNSVIRVTSFLPENTKDIIRIFCIVNDITSTPRCLTCSTDISHKFNSTTGFQKFCSAKCAQSNSETKAQIQDTFVQKYGQHPRKLEQTKAKQRATNLKKYGVEEVLASPEIRDKIARTSLDKYGVDHPVKSKEHITQKQKTNELRYGCSFPFQNTTIQKKVKNTIRNRYNTTATSKLDWVKKKAQLSIVHKYKTPEVYSLLNNKEWLFQQHHTLKRTLSDIASSLGLRDEKSISNKLRRFDIPIIQHHPSRSVGEQQVYEFLSSHGIECLANDRTTIPPKELDILIPEHNIAIEYCGLYWHSDTHKPRAYHADKYKACKASGIRLITLYEDEWKYKQDIVKHKLLSLLNKDSRPVVYARKCNIVNVDRSSKTKFFNDYHIQGSGPGSINLGLENNGILVACMSFIVQQAGTFVLNRYATSCRVVGGFSKLLSHFKKHYAWKQIISFADLRWSQGNLYDLNGFILDKTLPHDYVYIVDDKCVHKFNFRRKFLEHRLENFNPLLSEKENCDNNGILRLWDCGKLRYVMNNS